MSLKIAVASDLHCAPSSIEPHSSLLLSDGPRVPVSQHPVASLLKLIEDEKLTADILALPGDFTDKANPQGFIVGLFSARELAEKLQVNQIIASLGNHDVDSGKTLGEDPFYLGRCLFTDFPVSAEGERNRFYQSGFAVYEGEFWRCLNVNSVLWHTNSEVAKRGIVTDEQLEALEKVLSTTTSKDLQFCVVHHHPIAHENSGLGAHDLMEGGEKLLLLLEKHAYSLLIHGHKHHPRLRYSNSGRAGLPVFASGSLSAVISDRLARSARNTFHIIEVFFSSSTIPKIHGLIYTWEFTSDEGWVKSTHRSSGIAHRVGFGCQESLDSLGKKLNDLLEKKKYVPWEEACDDYAELKFLPPMEMRELERKLNPSGIRFDPSIEEPTLVGKQT